MWLPGCLVALPCHNILLPYKQCGLAGSRVCETHCLYGGSKVAAGLFGSSRVTGDKGKACLWKDTPQPLRCKQAVESRLGCHRAALGPADTRNAVCVPFSATGEAYLEIIRFGKKEVWSLPLPCRSHTWSHFGEINECLWMTLCNRSHSRWCF